MGEYLHGFHHEAPSGAGKGLYICGGRLANQICPFLRRTDPVYNVIGGRVILHGCLSFAWTPKTIVSDRDDRFMGAFWQDLFRLVGTELTSSMSYHL